MTEIPTGSLLPGLSSVDIITYSAREQFGLPITDEVNETWHSVMSVFTYLDAIEDGDYEMQGDLDVGEITAFMAGELEEPPQVPNLHARIALEGLVKNFELIGLEDYHRKEFADDSVELALLHAESSPKISVRALTKHRVELGRLFGRLFSGTVPDAYRTEGFIDFEEWMQAVGGLSEVIDSIWDIKDDHQTGRIQIKPSIKNRALLAWYAIPESRVALRSISPKLAGKLAVKAVLFGVNRSGRFNKYRTR